ncbi:hypothetical protein EDD90_0186 [Streptomyces sp. Ag109_O5-1]|nr:hypothetical protein EDD90_0186 [Streptomyces sp. Ag109_O5-1]
MFGRRSRRATRSAQTYRYSLRLPTATLVVVGDEHGQFLFSVRETPASAAVVNSHPAAMRA